LWPETFFWATEKKQTNKSFNKKRIQARTKKTFFGKHDQQEPEKNRAPKRMPGLTTNLVQKKMTDYESIDGAMWVRKDRSRQQQPVKVHQPHQDKQ